MGKITEVLGGDKYKVEIDGQVYGVVGGGGYVEEDYMAEKTLTGSDANKRTSLLRYPTVMNIYELPAEGGAKQPEEPLYGLYAHPVSGKLARKAAAEGDGGQAEGRNPKIVYVDTLPAETIERQGYIPLTAQSNLLASWSPLSGRAKGKWMPVGQFSNKIMKESTVCQMRAISGAGRKSQTLSALMQSHAFRNFVKPPSLKRRKKDDQPSQQKQGESQDATMGGLILQARRPSPNDIHAFVREHQKNCARS